VKKTTLTPTIVRAVRPKQGLYLIGQDLVKYVADAVIEAAKDGFGIENGDIIGITEALVAMSQNNFCTVDDITKSVREKLNNQHIIVVHPITSRNRFGGSGGNIGEGIVAAAKKTTIILNSPSDEQGNLLRPNANPYIQGNKVYTLDEYEKIHGPASHQFTGQNYPRLYEKMGAEVLICADPLSALKVNGNDKNIIAANIHNRDHLKVHLEMHGAKNVITLADIMSEPINVSGYNKDWGVLGANKWGNNQLKLFPRKDEAMQFALDVQKEIEKRTGAKVEVFGFGDGTQAPNGISEYADPSLEFCYTPGLAGESGFGLKVKDFAASIMEKNPNIAPKELNEQVNTEIEKMKNAGKSDTRALGTTPRSRLQILGTRADTTTGSSDKMTPIVHMRDK